MKKILLVGASGVIGSAVHNNLKDKYDVICAGRNGADLQFDANESKSIEAALENVDHLDGVINCFGKMPFNQFVDIKEDDFLQGMKNKFMGQVNVVRAVLPKLADRGSIVLTSGILSDQPIDTAVCAAAGNGAINAFVLALAAELQGRARVNAVSPSMVEDSIVTHGRLFDGFGSTSMGDLVNAYRYCLSGLINGKVIRLFREI